MQNQPFIPPVPSVPKKKRSKRFKIGCAVAVALFIVTLGVAIASAPQGNSVPAHTSSTPTVDLTGYYMTATAVDAESATQVASLEATDSAPADIPTPTAAQPTPTARPQPTVAIPTPRPTPKPTQPPPPTCQAVNNNPWCYNFSAGNYITNPPSNFCSYFNCIASFWNGHGFVNECQDTTYSLSGGIQGDCSHHGGELRPLYSH